MNDSQKRWSVVMRIMRVASGMSQEAIANAFHKDQAFASRVEAAKTVITPDVIAQWVEICGGRKTIDRVIRQLQALRNFVGMWELEPTLMQA